MGVYDIEEYEKAKVTIEVSEKTVKDCVMATLTEIQKQFKPSRFPQMAGAILSLLKEPSFFISGGKVSIRQLENNGIGTAIIKVGTKDFEVVFNIESNFHRNNREIWKMTSLVEGNFRPEFSWHR